MEFLEKYNLTPGKLIKIFGFGLLIILVVSFTLLLIGNTFNSIFGKRTNGISISSAPSLGSGGFLSKGSLDMSMDKDMGMMELSQRNMMFPEEAGYAAGDQAEEFEVTDYNARIETRKAENTCAEVATLKTRDYVIFEAASQYDRGCNFTFKVRKENVEEILGIIKSYNPKELLENVQTIQNVLDDYTGEVEILEKKLASIDETLEKAIAAYDEITEIATKGQDAESLANIIDSKINLIERLTNERMNINTQLDRISRSKEMELDRVDYTNFYISVQEIKYIDGKYLGETWKEAIREFVNDLNLIAQNVSVNLIKILLFALQYLLYAFILLVIAKYAWQSGKRIWKKK